MFQSWVKPLIKFTPVQSPPYAQNITSTLLEILCVDLNRHTESFVSLCVDLFRHTESYVSLCNVIWWMPMRVILILLIIHSFIIHVTKFILHVTLLLLINMYYYYMYTPLLISLHPSVKLILCPKTLNNYQIMHTCTCKRLLTPIPRSPLIINSDLFSALKVHVYGSQPLYVYIINQTITCNLYTNSTCIYMYYIFVNIRYF